MVGAATLQRSAVVSAKAPGAARLSLDAKYKVTRVQTYKVPHQSLGRDRIKAVVFKSQQPCPDTDSLDLDILLHSGVVCAAWGQEQKYEIRTRPNARAEPVSCWRDLNRFGSLRSPPRALPTGTKAESGTSRSKSGTFLTLGHSGKDLFQKNGEFDDLDPELSHYFMLKAGTAPVSQSRSGCDCYRCSQDSHETVKTVK